MTHFVKVKPLEGLVYDRVSLSSSTGLDFFCIPPALKVLLLLPPRKCCSFTVHYDTWQTSFVIVLIGLFSVK